MRKVLYLIGSPREPPETLQWAEWIATAYQAELQTLWLTGRGSRDVLDRAVREGTDLIVVSAPKLDGSRSPRTARLSQEVAWKAQCPVLAVCEDGGSEPRPIVKRIVVPMDESPRSDTALRYAKELALLAGANLALLHMIPAGVPQDPEYPGTDEAHEMAELKEGAVRHLGERLEHVGGPEVPAVAVAKVGHPVLGIIAFARDYGADLIVMASHGDSGFKRAVIGSVTEGVIRRIPCPVLIVKTSGKQLLRAGLLPRQAPRRVRLERV